MSLTAAMLGSQTSSLGVKHFSYVNGWPAPFKISYFIGPL